MRNKREYLKTGTILDFGNERKFVIDEIVGCGGTALTYYGRELIEGQEPVRILLKELFPNISDYRRNQKGTIVGTDIESTICLRELKEAMYQEQELGNQIAQKKIFGVYPMKQVVQEINNGNYYGLFYQCPPSITLRTLVEKAGDQMSPCGKLKLIRSLCRLVRSLHEEGGYCHNDISGGNVLILSYTLSQLEKSYIDWASVESGLQVGLIDFACAAEIDQNGEAVFQAEDGPMRFHTEGFSAPELYEAGERRVTITADVYSVAACLWYLLTGEVLEVEDGYPILGKYEWRFLEKCLRRHEFCSLGGDARIAFERNPNPVPEDMIRKIKSLLEEGLAEQWIRFGDISIFEERLQEIIDQAEGFSVSDDVLRDRLKTAFCKTRDIRHNKYLIQKELLPAAITNFNSITGKEEFGSLTDLFLAGESLYAIGDGGIGKTTAMFYSAESLLEKECNIVPIYMELNHLQMWKQESGLTPEEYWMGQEERPKFLEQYLAGVYYGSFKSLEDQNNLVVGALQRKIEGRYSGDQKYICFLDGLNEMTFSGAEEKIAFCKAINWYLQYGFNIRLIITSRYDESLIDLNLVRRVHVTGLSDIAIHKKLKTEVQQGRLTEKEYNELVNGDPNSNLWKGENCVENIILSFF